jgi:perosamine synthetase
MISKTISFIKKLYDSEEFIPLHVPRFLGREKEYLIECIDSTFVSYVGKYVAQFEDMTAKFTGAKYAVAVVNGTVALQIALKLAGVKYNDEVITQPLTFIASCNAIKHLGAFPTFVDVEKETLSMSPEKLDEFLNCNLRDINGEKINKITGRKIKAIVPVHIFGHPNRIQEIIEVAAKYELPVVEDSAESLGSSYKGKHTGTFGKLGILSYNGNKTLTTGGGGMIITNDKKLADQARHITTTAKIPHRYEYIHDEIGYNYRLTNINAALGVAQMEYINEILDNKKNTAEEYRNFFGDSEICYCDQPINSKSNFWLNTILLKDFDQRNKFLEETNNSGIMTRPVWRLMNKLEMFKDCYSNNLSNAEWLEKRLVNIPSSYRLIK